MQYGTTSQDAVVELAVERLYRDARDEDEAARWADAADDLPASADVGRIARRTSPRLLLS